jgi:hypothetical protein
MTAINLEAVKLCLAVVGLVSAAGIAMIIVQAWPHRQNRRRRSTFEIGGSQEVLRK